MESEAKGYADRAYIKLFDGVLDDRDLQSMPAERFRFLVNCWLLARRCGAVIGTAEEIAFKLRMPDEKAVELCHQLEVYLVDSGGRYEVRNWEYWQTKGVSTLRVKAHRERKRGEFSTGETQVKHHETIVKHDETSGTSGDVSVTVEKKRKEKKRKECEAADAAHSITPSPSAQALLTASPFQLAAPKAARFVPPTTSGVEEYARSIGYQIDAAKFVDYHASKGWVVGRAPMKDWQAAVRTWRGNDASYRPPRIAGNGAPCGRCGGAGFTMPSLAIDALDGIQDAKIEEHLESLRVPCPECAK